MPDDITKIEALVSELKDYVNTRVDQVKLVIAEKLSKILAYTLTVLTMVLMIFLILVLVSVSAAIAIGQRINNLWLGFIIVAGFCLILGLIMWMARDRMFRKRIMNKMISVFFKDENEKDQ